MTARECDGRIRIALAQSLLQGLQRVGTNLGQRRHGGAQ
jgi:hypothetical protein